MRLKRKVKTTLWILGLAAMTSGIYGGYYAAHADYLAKTQIRLDRSMKKAYDRAYNKLTAEFADIDSVEYGTSFSTAQLIKSHKGSLITEGTVDPFTVGEYTLTCTLHDTDKKYGQVVEKTIEKTVSVVDTKAPEIVLAEENIAIKQDKEYDPLSNIVSALDPVDGNVETKAETDLNTAVPGVYTVKVSAEDKNGNTAEREFQVTVVKRPHFTGTAGQIYDYLTDVMGLNDAAACGVLANMWAESNFIPTAGDYYYGLCQWGDNRRAELASWCSANGYDYTSVLGQCAFMYHELSTSYTGCLYGLYGVPDTADGAYQAALIFVHQYEGAASEGNRPSLAVSYYNS
ncbi:MAG: hypothetical protein K6G61_12690 [Solobacterium sp.]|nr:hypothetical protein [Solobacterium sp.]